METGITKQKIIAELTRSPHGDLKAYLPVGREAARQEPEFLAHLIAWDSVKGQVRDAKVALPVVSLHNGYAYAENSLAHLAMLDPRNLVRGLDFAKGQTQGYSRSLNRVVERYLRAREGKFGWWEKTALQHRASLKTLYARYHVKPAGFADDILFKGKRSPGSVFEAVARLKDMPAMEAAGTIMERRIPFLVAVSALGKRAKETELVLALIERMSPTELVSNTKMLERLGIKDVPALRSAYETGLKKVADSKKVTLKTTRAAEAMTDSVLKAKLVSVQEKQIANNMSIDGNWLVGADKSSSMSHAIEPARVVAATLAKAVTGKVWLVWFDSGPRLMDVTGLTYDQIKIMTAGVEARGNTSIGCVVQYAISNGLDVSGIAVVSDGGENTAPIFAEAYGRLCKVLDKAPAVYFYQLTGDRDVMTINMERGGFEMQTFDLRGGFDMYSLPNVVRTMKSNPYSLVDEIFATPLKTLDEVFA